jgi:hypothetical protein
MIDPQSRYGYMRAVEADLFDEMMDTLKREFGEIRFLEVGVFGAGTVRGVYRRAKEIDCPVMSVGVDFESYRPNPTPGDNYEFHGGDSADVWRNIKGEFNFAMIDGCHCVNHAMMDFLNFSPMVRVGGYLVFHDTALPTGHEKQEEWPQTDHGYFGKPPSSLGVREGLIKMGLLQGYRTDWKLVKELESDSGLMGMVLLKKLAPLQ